MNKLLDQIALGKKIDIIFQCLLFVVMILTIKYTAAGPFGLYVMAIGQVVSSLIWVFILSGDTPKMPSGNYIRTIFLVVGGMLLSLLGLDGQVFFGVSIAMLIIGPVLGISYFVITVKEFLFYSKARKPYYLL